MTKQLGAWPVPGVNIFSGEGQGKFYHVAIAKEKLAPLPNKKVDPSGKVTPSDYDEKGTNILNDVEESVVTIRRKDLDKFQGQSAKSTGWLNLDQD